MARDEFRHDLTAMAALLQPIRRRTYQFVARQDAPVGRDEVANALRMSRARAAVHLDTLVQAGLLRASYRRLTGRTGPGAGRPAKLYRRSRRRFDLSIPQREHELLASLLATSLAAPGHIKESRSAAHAYGRSIGVRARRRLPGRPTAAQIARCVEDVMAELGFEPTRSTDGELRARNCPFDPVSRRLPEVVCRAAIEFLGGVLEGTRVKSMEVHRVEKPPWCCVVVSDG